MQRLKCARSVSAFGDGGLGYTQSPHLSVEEIDSFLRKAEVARFCSLNADGTIHAVPVWYTYEHGQIIIFTITIALNLALGLN